MGAGLRSADVANACGTHPTRHSRRRPCGFGVLLVAKEAMTHHFRQLLPHLGLVVRR